jgi:hypothetical protein
MAKTKRVYVQVKVTEDVRDRLRDRAEATGISLAIDGGRLLEQRLDQVTMWGSNPTAAADVPSKQDQDA